MPVREIAPGDGLGSIGTLTLNGNLMLNSGAAVDFELATPSTSDLISMSSFLLTLNGQQFPDFNFAPLAGFGPGMYLLIDAGSINGTLGAHTNGLIDGFNAVLGVQGNDLILNVTAVPEPSTLVLLGMGAISLLAYVWQRWKA